ncbi:Hypothetical predicted protein [Mytilus galloprovincialis]|uniref:LRRCT domain-containing protein n=1 Tax=Mytilus galloprovincialis TaxID=29158 RepID=A0A8B6DP76_MYTGA|nr:Hypothetical predicted protein [Mytilus galloprovincialis]
MLSSLPPELFSMNTKLQVIYVDNNPLVCCDLTDFIEWLDLQTKLTEFSGQCTYLANATDIRGFNTSECIKPESCKHGHKNIKSDEEWKIPRRWKGKLQH